MILRAFWLELFKLRKRLATWTCYLIFLALTLLVFGPYFYGVPGPGGAYRRGSDRAGRLGRI
jgi:hypothetical protein